jgi:hypothetical protein
MATRTYTLNTPGISSSGRGWQLPPNDAKNFEKAVGDFIKVLKLNVATVVRSVALELRERIIKKNPVDTGRSRDAWQLTVDNPSAFKPAKPWTHEDRRGKNWPPPAPASALAQVIDGTRPVFLTNNVDYVEALENGLSDQAPSGFIRLSIMEITSEIGSIVRRALAGEQFTFSAKAGDFDTQPLPRGKRLPSQRH